MEERLPMSRSTRDIFIVLVISTVVVGCDFFGDVVAVPPVAPFNDLEGVTPGITVGELKRLRPNASFREFGFAEPLRGSNQEGNLIVYDVAGTGFDGDHQPPDYYWLRSISWKTWVANDDSARTEWVRTVEEWQATVGTPMCRTERTAVWQWEKFELLVSWSISQSANPPGHPARVEKALREPGYAFPQANHCLAMGS